MTKQSDTPRTDAVEAAYISRLIEGGGTQSIDEMDARAFAAHARELECELGVIQAKLAERNKTDPVTRLHNLCDALNEDAKDSPYSAEAWALQEQAYRAKCEELAAARKSLSETQELLCAARVLLTYAHGAAGKIDVERQRGAGYYHAEVDWLLRVDPAIRAWMFKARAHGCIDHTFDGIVEALEAELPALEEARRIENSMKCAERPACSEGRGPEAILRCYKCPMLEAPK